MGIISSSLLRKWCPEHKVERAAALPVSYSAVLGLLPNPLITPPLVHSAFTPSLLIAAGFCVFNHPNDPQHTPMTHVAGPDKFLTGLSDALQAQLLWSYRLPQGSCFD